MPTKFVFEELDSTTRNYLLHARANDGAGQPGVFIPGSNWLAGLGCIVGPVVIGLTLLFTLTNLAGVIFDDPGGVALLQTAGILVGGWMLVAAVRIWWKEGSPKFPGYWVYADPLHLYEARAEQVAVYPLADAVEAQFTHNYNNNKYQSSTVRIALPQNAVCSVTVVHERRAEELVTFVNYLAWARGPEGGERRNLPPATLGGLARYVSKNDHEPLNAEGRLNLDLLEVDAEDGEVPAEPHREGRATPAILPYVVLLLAGVACFFVMRAVNIPLRDDAIFEAVTTPPVEPRYLRAYLMDSRNTRHRDEVYAKLGPFYDPGINYVRQTATNPQLRDGMVQVLESLKKAEIPIVAIRVTERQAIPGTESGTAGRVEAFWRGVRTTTVDTLNKVTPAIVAPPGVVLNPAPPPIGDQLIDFAFVQEPADAPAHFEVDYSFTPTANGKYLISAKVAIRVSVDDPPVAIHEIVDRREYTATQAAEAVNGLRETLMNGMLGTVAAGGPMKADPDDR